MHHKFMISIVMLLGMFALLRPSVAHADPIQLPAYGVTASATYSGSSPGYAMDGSSSTLWNSGGFGPQWIQIDLGKTAAIRKIKLQVAQSPSGNTVHEIAVGQNPNSLTKVDTLRLYTSDGQWIESKDLAGDGGNVRYIRVTTTSSPSWIAWKEIQIQQGVEYFGYYFDAALESHISETAAAGANMHWVWGSTQDELTTKLRATTASGGKAMVYLSSLFTYSSGWVLRSDWTDQWNVIKAAVSAVPNSVAAFYPADEPIQAGYSLADLTTVVNRVKADFPQIPLAVIFTTGDLYDGRVGDFVKLYNWLGYDCYYGDWNTCNGNGIPTYNSRLRSLLSSGQRMMAVPWAFYWQDWGIDANLMNRIVQVISKWHAEVVSDATYVAVAPFIWQDGYYDGNSNPAHYGIGASSLPPVKERLYQFAGSLFGSGSTVYPVDHLASSSYSGSFPFSAFNRDSADAWNAGSLPTAYLQANFPGSTRIKDIYLRVAQSPYGTTTHVLQGLSNGSWISLTTFQGNTSEGQILHWTGTADVSAVRVTTTQGPSWVAWHELLFRR